MDCIEFKFLHTCLQYLTFCLPVNEKCKRTSVRLLISSVCFLVRKGISAMLFCADLSTRHTCLQHLSFCNALNEKSDDIHGDQCHTEVPRCCSSSSISAPSGYLRNLSSMNRTRRTGHSDTSVHGNVPAHSMRLCDFPPRRSHLPLSCPHFKTKKEIDSRDLF